MQSALLFPDHILVWTIDATISFFKDFSVLYRNVQGLIEVHCVGIGPCVFIVSSQSSPITFVV